MRPSKAGLDRRDFLQTAGSTATALLAGAAAKAEDRWPRVEPPPRDQKARGRVAVVTTAYYYLSHAYHLCGRFLHGYLRDGRGHFPDYQVAGMYVDQPKHPGD